MTFITTPFMRSFVGFDQLFNELENTSHVKDHLIQLITLKKLEMRNISFLWQCRAFQRVIYL